MYIILHSTPIPVVKHAQFLINQRDSTKPGLWTHGLDYGLEYELDYRLKFANSVIGKCMF